VIDSTQEKSQQMTDQIVKPLIKELNGYMKVFVFDCMYEKVQKEKEKF
jgi:hypothetical protein